MKIFFDMLKKEINFNYNFACLSYWIWNYGETIQMMC